MTNDITTADTTHEDLFDGEIDFEPDEVADVSNVTLQPGTYDAVVEDVEKRQGQKGPYYNWKFRTTDPDFPDVPLYRITSLGEKSLPYTKRTLVAILGGPLPAHFSIVAHKELFIGRPVRLKVKLGEWEGVQRSEVDQILAAGPMAKAATPGAKPTEQAKKPAKMF